MDTDLYQAPLAGGAATLVCSGLPAPTRGAVILTDAGHVYVAENGSNGINAPILAIPK